MIDRYRTLPMNRNIRNWKWEGKDYPRVQSLLYFEDFVETKYKNKDIKLLTFNGKEDPEVEILSSVCQISGHLDVAYEDNPEKNDLHNLKLDIQLEESFDLIMLNQTLEHLYNPIKCVQNVKKYLKSGGMLYMNAPANNIPHGEPHHYYTGFTPIGLSRFFQEAEFKMWFVESWGNVAYIKSLFEKNTWPDYTALPDDMENEKKCPCIVWGWGVK